MWLVKGHVAGVWLVKGHVAGARVRIFGFDPMAGGGQ